MAQIQLAIATANFLLKQQLMGFKLTFDPTPRRGGRRSKRGDTWIEVEEVSDRTLSGGRTAEELIEAFFHSAPEVKAWTVDTPRYKAVLTDPFGDEVKLMERLEDLRRREADRQLQDRADAAKVLEKAFSTCEEYLEPRDLKKLALDMLKERY